MTTIGDKIREWENSQIRGSSVMTRNTEAYNHMSAAVQALLAQPWATIVLQPDMDHEPEQGTITGSEEIKTIT